jgi:hypothetical protein
MDNVFDLWMNHVLEEPLAWMELLEQQTSA